MIVGQRRRMREEEIAPPPPPFDTVLFKNFCKTINSIHISIFNKYK